MTKRETANFGARIYRQGNATEANALVFMFDVTINERTNDSAVITAHPVENGVDINDHIQDDPFTLDLTCGVSNAPVYGDDTPDRDLEALKTLRKIKRDKKPLVIILPGSEYRDMYLQRIGNERSARSGQAIRPTFSFVQLTIAGSMDVVVPAAKKKKTKKMADKNPGNTKKGKGINPTTDKTGSEQTQNWFRILLGQGDMKAGVFGAK